MLEAPRKKIDVTLNAYLIPLYSWQNLFKMNVRFLFLFLLIGLRLSAQSINTNLAPQNNNNAVIPNESLNEEKMDTVSMKSEQEKREESIQQKKQSVQLKDDASTSFGYSTGVSQQIQQTSTLFVTTRQQASTQRTQRTPSAVQQEQMNQYVLLLSQAAPESFEHHYYSYLAGNYNIELIDHLRKAEALRPENSDVHIQIAAYDFITNNLNEARKYLKKLHTTGRINEVMLAYGKDLMRSVPENGYLITHGFEDTYAAYYAQIFMNERSDVTIISLDFLQSEAYRSALTTNGFTLPNSSVIDVAYLTEFCALNATKKLSVSLTVPKEYLVPNQQHMFVTGLVMEYHAERCTGIFERNEQLWNTKLSAKITTVGRDKARSLSANYLPMLLLLRKEYQTRGQQDEVQKIDVAIDQIAVQCGKYEQVQSIKANY
ncbi:MAG: hypothetical protein RL632_594 [Bacteroidota bacterium]